MKIAMMGSATGRDSIKEILHLDSTFKIWGLNAIRPDWTEGIEWDAMFNLHHWDHLVRDWINGVLKESEWAKSHPVVPFYTVDRWPHNSLPNRRDFPRKKLEKMPMGTYHAGSFDWLVAFATYLKAKEIRLYGIKLAVDGPGDEPISARACLEYWCGYAAGKGIKIKTMDCELFNQYHLVKSNTVYGYDDIKLIEERK
jgi:hypothetical protein